MDIANEATARDSPSLLRLAYISPLPPERSGISDYSAELLPELSRHYEIEVIVSQDSVSDPWIEANCPIRSLDWFRAHVGDYDRGLYHFGNSVYHQHMFSLLSEVPGIVVLHDFYLSGIIFHMDATGYLPGIWSKSLFRSHGYSALKKWFFASDPMESIWQYPCNRDVIQRALGVVVHSENSRRLAHKWYGQHVANDWAVIPLLRIPNLSIDKALARRELNISDNHFVICSFGMTGPTKLNHHLLNAWISSDLAKDENCMLVFVGENDTGDFGSKMINIIHRSGLDKRIQITGWVDQDTYRHYLAAADMGVQLRTLSRGETSAAVMDCLNYGLPTIVNSNGSMADLPDNSVWKLSDEFSEKELINALENLWREPFLQQQFALNARKTVHTYHDPRICAEQYARTIEEMYRITVKNTSDAPPALTEAKSTLPSSEAWAIFQRLKKDSQLLQRKTKAIHTSKYWKIATPLYKIILTIRKYTR